jgi:drug/metabolite transporter (DMT)-like permease
VLGKVCKTNDSIEIGSFQGNHRSLSQCGWAWYPFSWQLALPLLRAIVFIPMPKKLGERHIYLLLLQYLMVLRLEQAVPTSALIPALLGATMYVDCGLVTCAYTIYAQSFGHRRVGPTDANLIYTEQPIFTALFAWELLGARNIGSRWLCWRCPDMLCRLHHGNDEEIHAITMI